MSVPIGELEKLLQQHVSEHRTLLAAVMEHTDAMRSFNAARIAAAMDALDASRKRIQGHEVRRNQLMQQVIRTHKFPANITLRQIAAAVPEHTRSLTKVREELRDLATQISVKTSISARIANSLLGHLNTVVRIVAGAMQQSSVYTRHGVPSYTRRVGMIEAVG